MQIYLFADVTLSLYSTCTQLSSCWRYTVPLLHIYTKLSSCWRDTLPLLLKYSIIFLLTWHCSFTPEVLNYLLADVTLSLYFTSILNYLLADVPLSLYFTSILNYLLADVTLSLYSWSTQLSSCWRVTLSLYSWSTELSSCWRDTVPLLHLYCWLFSLVSLACIFNPHISILYTLSGDTFPLIHLYFWLFSLVSLAWASHTSFQGSFSTFWPCLIATTMVWQMLIISALLLYPLDCFHIVLGSLGSVIFLIRYFFIWSFFIQSLFIRSILINTIQFLCRSFFTLLLFINHEQKERNALVSWVR